MLLLTLYRSVGIKRDEADFYLYDETSTGYS